MILLHTMKHEGIVVAHECDTFVLKCTEGTRHIGDEKHKIKTHSLELYTIVDGEPTQHRQAYKTVTGVIAPDDSIDIVTGDGRLCRISRP